ncbi:lipopolysaccharide heptosyltransferase II [Deferrisoma camini]|uniref:lipopolysaccharide heptosyltransferase II n=1 Tax=Deferrisoma camini TaxID=1035120 RepID=UPI00046D834B|nr:lipopolysaccharide heptosyltransferase II [Deferrisoma camini]
MNRVLVIQTAFLGDVVLTTPLFRALRRRFPDARLDVLVTPAAAPLVEEDPHLDEVLRYDKKGGERLGSVARRLRGRGYDLIVAPHRSHRTALLARWIGAVVRVGFRDAGLWWLYTRRVTRPAALHEVDRNLELLRGLGLHPEPEDRVLHVGYTEREVEEVERVLAEAGGEAHEPLAALAPGSVWATKRWPAERFAEVGRGLQARGLRVVVLGGPDDRAVAQAVCAAVGAGAVNAAGKTSLKALAAWMDRVRLLVTNDSAPLHVAAARGTPTVAVFGATTLDLGFGPFHAASRVVEAEVECRPCGLHGGRRCRKGHFRCMLEVTPEEVLAACRELVR